MIFELILIYLILTILFYLAAFTSKASGDVDAAGQTTWVEVGVPGTGDTWAGKDTHVLRVDSGTGDWQFQSGVIEDGCKLVIDSEDTAEVDAILDDHAAAGIDLQDGGELEIIGTTGFHAKLRSAGNTNRKEYKFNGILNAAFWDFEDIYPTNSYIDVTGLIGDISDFLGTAYNNNKYYMKGLMTSMVHERMEWQDLYYAIQNATYDFYFNEPPNRPSYIKPPIYVNTPVAGRGASRISMVGSMAEHVTLQGAFHQVANKWKTEDLERMRNSLGVFSYSSPKKIIATVRMLNVTLTEPPGAITTHPYTVELLEDL